jgi:hypothetical protein
LAQLQALCRYLLVALLSLGLDSLKGRFLDSFRAQSGTRSRLRLGQD